MLEDIDPPEYTSNDVKRRKKKHLDHALFEACKSGNGYIIRCLMRHGADPWGYVDSNRLSCLHYL